MYNQAVNLVKQAAVLVVNTEWPKTLHPG